MRRPADLSLPVNALLQEIIQILKTNRSLPLQAPPGARKTAPAAECLLDRLKATPEMADLALPPR
jgi:HrpA-like RNA helicase